MKIKELTPAITAKYLADMLNPLLQEYVGKICLFWDESTHYYGCIGGNDEGILGLIREIKAVPSYGYVNIEIRTCNRAFSCDIDNFYIEDDPASRCIVDDISFRCDEDGNFEDLELEPIFQSFDIGEIEYLGFQEVISGYLKDLITENFMGKYCIIEDESDDGDPDEYECPDEDDEDNDGDSSDDDDYDPNDPTELIEDLYFEPVNEDSLVNLVHINGRGIAYQDLHIRVCQLE